MLNKRTVLLLHIILLLFLIHSTAMAGGVRWLFQVKEFREVKSGEHIILLKPLDLGEEFPLNCDVLTVHVKYSTWRWLFVNDKLISKENHNKALSLIKASFASKSPVAFGVMGEGFGYEGEKTSCEVYSRALTVFEVDGNPEVYSYFKWP